MTLPFNEWIKRQDYGDVEQLRRAYQEGCDYTKQQAEHAYIESDGDAALEHINLHKKEIETLCESRDRAQARITELEAQVREQAELIALQVKEIDRLRTAIRKHRNQHGDDRCWLDDKELYAVLNDGVEADNTLPPREKFLANCARFYENRCQEGDWPSYQELEAEVARLRALLPVLAEAVKANCLSVVQPPHPMKDEFGDHIGCHSDTCGYTCDERGRFVNAILGVDVKAILARLGEQGKD